MMIRSGTGTRVYPRSGRVTESTAAGITTRGSIFPGPIDRAVPVFGSRPVTRRDDRSGKPGTPVRGRYPADWEPRGEYE